MAAADWLAGGVGAHLEVLVRMPPPAVRDPARLRGRQTPWSKHREAVERCDQVLARGEAQHAAPGSDNGRVGAHAPRPVGVRHAGGGQDSDPLVRRPRSIRPTARIGAADAPPERLEPGPHPVDGLIALGGRERRCRDHEAVALEVRRRGLGAERQPRHFAVARWRRWSRLWLRRRRPGAWPQVGRDSSQPARAAGHVHVPTAAASKHLRKVIQVVSRLRKLGL